MRNFVLAALLLIAVWAAPAARADLVWLESETPTSVAPGSYTLPISNDGKPEYLSGGKWLQINLDAAGAQKAVPADGIVLTYNFTAPKAAAYEIWNRIGFERVRTAFDWRIDSGAWTTIPPTQDTLDVEELQVWNPVGWLDMGAQTLTTGAHTLQIRLAKATGALNYASDALCLTTTPFHPDGPRKPGDPAAQTDADKAAAAQVFQVTSAGPVQTATPLRGTWQIAADDEMVMDDRLGPIKEAPPADDLSWHAVSVPGDRNGTAPEMAYVHRYFLRTRVNVPANLAGRSFYLHVPSENMIATVFVNGRQCGWTKAPFADWQCDITQAIKPGQANEVWVGIKDDFYASTDPTNTKHLQYLPYGFWHFNAFMHVDMPIGSHFENGLLLTPSLVVAGKAYVSDVYAMPSVKNKALGLEITLHNPTDQPITVSLDNSVKEWQDESRGVDGVFPVAKKFAAQAVVVPAASDQVVTVSEGWATPKLWWPDSPTQYTVTTTLSAGGQPIDARSTKFGFREWDWHGPQFTLNGVPWHGRADLADFGQANEAAAALWHKHGQTMQRIWAETSYDGKDMPDALDFFDSHGIPNRRTGIFDGEGAAYNTSGENKALYDNWRLHLAAWVKGQRNHPSIFLWSMENEITFINAHVFGQDAVSNIEMKKAWDVLHAVDPTRPVMTDGGNALLDESLPVYGGHYMEPPSTSLPEGAYDKAGFAHRQVWPITQEKPIIFGEDFYAAGFDLADLATVGGESAFVGKAEAHPAIGIEARMLSEGYRWLGINFHFWMGGESDAYYNSWQPIAVLCRQWDSSFLSGQKVTRTLGIFNDSHEDLPISLTWTLVVSGKKAASETSLHKVAGGMNSKFDVVVPMPVVTGRQEGTWTLALTVNGKPVFQDVRPISVLSPTLSAARLYHRTGFGSTINATAPAGIAVYDPYGSVVSFLTKEGITFTKLTSLRDAPTTAKVLVVGKDALTPAQSTSSQLAAFASTGRAVVVLEQKNPLKFQALPGAMAPDANAGNIAFIEDMNSPVMRGLSQRDFFTWGPNGQVYQNAYQKPTAGGKSLVQCNDRLQDTALAQMQAGKGIMLLSQLLIGQKLMTHVDPNQPLVDAHSVPIPPVYLPPSPIAQQLLLNMIGYGQAYKQVFHPVTAVAPDNPQLTKALDATGLNYTKATDPLEALSKPGSIAVIVATPANLHALASNPAKVTAFTQGGGWILFNNLTPDGLADYNKIVGVSHMIRPYKQEKVTWPTVRNPLTGGLAASSIVMGTGQQIFNFESGQYPDTDAYSYVVDLDEVAPFGTSPWFGWNNLTNNYTQNDGFWPLIENFPGPDIGKTLDIPITLPRPEKITQFTYVQDLNYNPTSKIALLFNGTDKQTFDVPANGDPQTFALNPPRTAQNITLQIVDWGPRPGKNGNIGLDNIYLKAARPADFYEKVKPMLNIGAMVEYPKGAGGIVLCNVKFKDSEGNPENTGKKQTIIATLLRNLNAPFSGGKTIIAGANNLMYTPIDLSKQANQYRTDQGWFGDKAFTFAALPAGKQTFAGVGYSVYHFTTSPVPEAIMLGGNGIPGSLPDHVSGIPVNQKADALFFLQAARIDQRRNGDEVKQGKQPEMADYIITYADGTTAKVPIYSEINVDDYKQQTPAALPGAQIAWTAPYAKAGPSAVAYSQQWNNPSPDKVIKTIDLVYGPDRRGVPALLAVTAAKAP